MKPKKPLSLTKDQQFIYENVINDIVESNSGLDVFQEHTFVSVTGPAGTGKTFLSRSIVETLLYDKNYKIAVLAPTHKALNVIKSNINISHKKLLFASVHSFLGLKPKIDNKTGVQHFVKDTSKKTVALSNENVDLMIIDESSFIGTELWEHIKKEVIVYSRVKSVLFFGDELQLLPVENNEPLVPSKTTKSSNITKTQPKAVIHNKTNKNFKHYNLTEVIRNGNTEVLDFYTKIRKMVETDASRKDLMTFLVDESKKKHEKVHFFRNKKEFFGKYLSEDRIGKEEDTVFTFTNKDVDGYNSKLRNFYLRKHLQSLSPDKKITQIPEIHVSDLFVIQQTTEDFQNSETVRIKYINYTDFEYMDRKFKGFKCTTTDNRELKILSFVSKELYDRSCELLKLNAAKTKNGEHWKKYYELLNLFHKVKFQYSSTIHKAQGSTVENSYVDCSQIDYVDDTTLLRLFYVASTRAKNEVNILL